MLCDPDNVGVSMLLYMYYDALLFGIVGILTSHIISQQQGYIMQDRNSEQESELQTRVIDVQNE